MARNSKKRHYKSARRATYVSGSAARELAPKPQEQVRKRHVETSEERRERLRRQKNQRQANKINMIFMGMMTMAVAISVAVCYQLVSLQSEYKANQTKLDDLKTEYQELKSDNDELDAKLDASIDYEAIYNTAVNELGMVYPDSSQVILYESGESEYVKQYKDVPGQE